MIQKWICVCQEKIKWINKCVKLLLIKHETKLCKMNEFVWQWINLSENSPISLKMKELLFKNEWVLSKNESMCSTLNELWNRSFTHVFASLKRVQNIPKESRSSPLCVCVCGACALHVEGVGFFLLLSWSGKGSKTRHFRRKHPGLSNSLTSKRRNAWHARRISGEEYNAPFARFAAALVRPCSKKSCTCFCRLQVPGLPTSLDAMSRLDWKSSMTHFLRCADAQGKAWDLAIRPTSGIPCLCPLGSPFTSGL